MAGRYSGPRGRVWPWSREAIVMEFLSEDATYLAGGLGLLGLVFLIALRVTQRGRFLVWA